MNYLDNEQKKYHSEYYNNILKSGEIGYDGFINKDSIWYWMHTFCLQELDTFFSKIPHSYFLTVGDGYCGRESSFIKKYGHEVHASDIETCLIKIAYDKDLIDEYSIQDMNNLSFKDRTFDYVLVKESLHHLSKPYQGIYEMMRVSKKGIILIEPNGDYEQKYKYNNIEESGNYCFSFNSHELIKIGLSMGYDYFVISYSNMFYGQHDINNILNNRIEIEKERLIKLDNEMIFENKPLLIFLFLKDERDYDLFKEKKFKRIKNDNNDNRYFKSQYGQDRIALEILNKKDTGFFVELGASDGVEFSNTYYFEKKLNWSGLLIEPNPNYYNDLKKNRNCYISNELCSDEKNIEVDFLLNGNISGIVDNNSGYWIQQNLDKHSIRLKTSRLEDILDEFNVPKYIDFLSLDVEGYEFNILKNFPFEKYKIELICVEHNSYYDGLNNKNLIKELLLDKNYELIKETIQDDFYLLKK